MKTLLLLLSLLLFSACTSDNVRYIDKSIRIVITPTNVEVPVGTEGDFRAFAYEKDGSSKDVTDLVTWKSSNRAVGDFNTSVSNYAKALSVGTTTVSAIFDGISSNEAKIVVTNATLDSITLSPTILHLPVGVEYKYKAIGLYSDKTTHDLTPFAIFNSSNSSVATLTSVGANGGVLRAKAIGSSLISAVYDGKTSNDSNLSVTAATLSSLVITPIEISVPKGTKDRYTATAYYTDATGYDVTLDASWTSSNTSVVSIDASGASAGEAYATAVGDANITASYKGINSNIATVKVTVATLESIKIIPQEEKKIPSGLTYQYRLIAYYSDASTKDITEDAIWSSSKINIANIIPTGKDAGFTQAMSVGESVISAQIGGLVDGVVLHVSDAVVESIAITPTDANISISATQQYLATATYSDASVRDITSVAAWQSSDTTIAPIQSIGSGGGIAHGVVVGTTTITAHYGGKDSNMASLKVIGKVIDNIQITPKNTTVKVGETQEYIVHAIYTDLSLKDITADSTVSSTEPATVSIEDGNIAHTHKETDLTHNVFIEAVYNLDPSFTTKTAIHIVSPSITSLEIFPKDTTIVVGAKGNFKAVLSFSDGTTQDVTTTATWNSSSTTVVSISSTGAAEALVRGDSNITAIANGVTSRVSVITVDDNKTIKNVQITPNNISLYVGETQVYEVSVIYDDHTIEDVTEFAPITSLQPAYFKIENGSLGVAIKEGAAELTATYKGVKSEREFVHIITQ